MSTKPFLTNTAASEYLEDCRFSLWMGIFGPDEFLGRMLSLVALCEPNSPVWGYCTGLLSIEADGTSEDWADRLESSNENYSGTARSGVFRISDGANGDDSVILQFIPSLASGLSAWEFHKGDADPFPSVPHGHQRRSDSRKKLDAYRGYVYRLGKQIERVERDSIVALWNDNNFRVFAREALEHFIASRPGWQWPMKDPLRLPRKRRR